MVDRFHFNNIVSFIEKPDVMFDVGVATMHTEGWWAKEVWDDVQLFGFEPCEARFNVLVGYPGILSKTAVTDAIGTFDGYMNNYDFRVLAEEDKADPYQTVAVNSTTIDSLDEIHGPFEKIFIWADIEGGELRLIKGAEKALKEKRIVGLNIEMWPNPPVDGWQTPDETVEYLKRFDYYIAFGEECSYSDWDRKSQMDFFFVPKK